MSFNLSIHTQKGEALDSEQLCDFQNRLMKICNIFPGTEYSSAINDPDSTKFFLENDAFLFEPEVKSAYAEYCRLRKLPLEPLDADIASDFWISFEGADIAFIKCPSQNDEMMKNLYSALISFCRAQGLRLYDPQTGDDVDLMSPDTFPPSWE